MSDAAVSLSPTGRRARLARWVLPDSQRKPTDEVVDALDLGSGESSSKRSAFWLMLTISAFIATAGVIADSTATVIGAMIIAPLGTPIMCIGLSLVVHNRSLNRSAIRFVVLGMVLVIAVGFLGAFFLPGTYDLLSNSQITGRTSPTLVDLVAAIATGFAGAIGISRRDVSDVLPGVAIAISLVPPLAVVGICAGQGNFSFAAGAFMLFLSNVLAMILSSTLVFALAHRPTVVGAGSNRRAYLTLGTLLGLVVIILSVNTALAIAVSIIESRVTTAANEWIAGVPGAELQDVSMVSNTVVVDVLAPTALPDIEAFQKDLAGQVVGLDVVVQATRGERIDVAVAR